MHPLYYVTAIVEYSPDVFSINGTGKMRIAIMFSISTGGAYSLCEEKKNQKLEIIRGYQSYYTYQKFIANKIFCPNKFR